MKIVVNLMRHFVSMSGNMDPEEIPNENLKDIPKQRTKKYFVYLSIGVLLVAVIVGYNQKNVLSKIGNIVDPKPPVKEFTITAKDYKFTPDSITVNEGDVVRITATNFDIDHGIAIDELGVWQPVDAGVTRTFEFVASKKGTFKFYCNVACGGGHATMKGNLTVE